jgi:hypothetical protein
VYIYDTPENPNHPRWFQGTQFEEEVGTFTSAVHVKLEVSWVNGERIWKGVQVSEAEYEDVEVKYVQSSVSSLINLVPLYSNGTI